MSNLFTELKRRNVFKVTAAYVVTGWLIVQVVDAAFPILLVPDWVSRVVVLLLIVGFPVALILAWAFELTPEGIKREKEVDRAKSITPQTGRKLDFAIIALLAVALAYFAYQHYFVPDQPQGSADTPTEAVGKSIAVLPFANRSASEENAEFFAAGVHDDLLTLLSKVGDLKVISRTSVERLDADLSIREIGDELNVATVLEGGVQRAGDQVRINVQLIDADSDEHLWAETYNRELTAANVFAIQSEIAGAITDALRAQLSARDQANIDKVPTQNLDALYEHQLGRQRLAKRSSASIREAMEHFERAVELDPDYALAWVSLAQSVMLLNVYGDLSWDERVRRSEPALEKALSLDPDLGEAYATIGLHKWRHGDLTAADTAFRRAIELNPNYASSHHWYSITLRDLGRWEESLAAILRARDLDPLSPVINQTVAESMAGLGRFDEESAYVEKVIEIDPGFANAHLHRAQIHWFVDGDLVAAVGDYERAVTVDPGNPYFRSELGRLYLDLGDVATAKTWVDKALELGPDNAAATRSAAQLNLYQGNLEESDRYLRRFQETAPSWFRTRIMIPRSGVTGDTPDEQIAWYREHYPELMGDNPPVDSANAVPVIDLARVLQESGRTEEADRLLERVMPAIKAKPRLGIYGYQIMDVEILALQGRIDEALAALREAIDAGWRVNWWLTRHDPNLDSIRGHPDFQAMLAELEADMTEQRQRLAEADTIAD